MYSVTLTSDLKPLDRIQQLARDWPDLVEDDARRYVLPFVSQQVRSRLAVTPGPVKRPVDWTSAKQKRAFFATDGFGHGIPYRRSGKLAASWQTTMAVHTGGLSITVENPNRAAPFVYGRWQQRFHRNTGWVYAPPVLANITQLTQPILLEMPVRIIGGVFGGAA